MTHDKCSIFTSLTVESETNTWWQGIITSPESPEYLWIPLGPIIINWVKIMARGTQSFASSLWRQLLIKITAIACKKYFLYNIFLFSFTLTESFHGWISFQQMYWSKKTWWWWHIWVWDWNSWNRILVSWWWALSHVCLSYYCCYCLSLTRITFHSIHCSDSCPPVRYKYRNDTGDFRSLWWDSIWWRYR